MAEEERIIDRYTKREFQKEKQREKDKFYIEISDIKTGRGIIDLEVFSDTEEMQSYLLAELGGLESGMEITIGKGKEGDKWFPTAVKDIITKEI